MAKPLCLVQAAIATRSGYGSHSRDIVRAMLNMDRFDVMIWGTRWGETPFIDLDTPRDREIFKRLLKEPTLPKQPEVFVHVTVPNEFQTYGRFNIGITAGIETTHCSAVWLEGLNRMHLNIVPSNHAKDVFTRTNYTKVDERTKQPLSTLRCEKPIEVLFEGVDTSVYRYDENVASNVRHTLNGIEETFCFLFVGHWLQGDLFHDRKDVGGLIKVFLETFKNVPNPPALVLKTALATYSIMEREEILRRIIQIRASVVTSKPLPNVYLLHGDLTTEEMNSLYNANKIKAHVSFTHGEGFGRPLLEATLSRKPVIASAWSGQVDFLKREFAILLPGQISKVHSSAVWENVIIPESSWFSVNYTVASNVLMDVWKNYQVHKQNALKQAMFSEQNFSLQKMQERFTEILDQYLPKFATEVPISLPQLSAMKLPKLRPITEPSVSNLATLQEGKQADLPMPKDEHETQITEQPKEEPHGEVQSAEGRTETAQ